MVLPLVHLGGSALMSRVWDMCAIRGLAGASGPRGSVGMRQDGICRPYAEGANGTVNSDGAGLLVLTRLSTATEKGLRVYATVRGVATNNDGARKAGYSAPSFEGQVEVARYTANGVRGIAETRVVRMPSACVCRVLK